MNGPNVITVTQLNKYVKSLLEGNPNLANVFVTGEISNFTDHYRSGHLYMTIKDEGAAIKAVMFATYKQNLKFKPENGLKVIIRGKVSLYDKDGSYQLYVYDMQPEGIGALALAFEQLPKKLEAQGLFDPSHKLPLPAFPENIGVISSPTGAAVQDVLNVLGRRYPLAPVHFCGVKVQGEGSAEQIIDAIEKFNKLNNVDVIIIARGGGSIEDLWEFNDENLAKAIYDSHIPIISGVGHETDYTICDLVADRRAPTPSAAAELAVPDSAEQAAYVRGIRNRLNILINSMMDSAEYRYANISSSNVLKSPLALIDAYDEKLNNMDRTIDMTLESSMERYISKHELLNSKLESLSPLKVLSRGYSLVKSDKGVVDSVKKVKVNDDLRIRLSDGEISAKVTEV